MTIKDHIRERYPNEPADLIARDLNITVSKVYNIAHRLGVKKSAEFLKSMAFNSKLSEKGKAHQYKKGLIPHNKGLKMPDELYNKVKRTMFKKGNKPHNTQPNGTIRINSKKDEKPYQYIKIADSDWRLLHRVIWEQHNGPIPDKHMIRFIDGDTMNCELSNLECVSMKKNMTDNTIQRYPEELQELMKLNAKLNRKINGKEQNQ